MIWIEKRLKIEVSKLQDDRGGVQGGGGVRVEMRWGDFAESMCRRYEGPQKQT